MFKFTWSPVTYLYDRGLRILNKYETLSRSPSYTNSVSPPHLSIESLYSVASSSGTSGGDYIHYSYIIIIMKLVADSIDIKEDIKENVKKIAEMYKKQRSAGGSDGKEKAGGKGKLSYTKDPRIWTVR